MYFPLTNRINIDDKDNHPKLIDMKENTSLNITNCITAESSYIVMPFTPLEEIDFNINRPYGAFIYVEKGDIIVSSF